VKSRLNGLAMKTANSNFKVSERIVACRLILRSALWESVPLPPPVLHASRGRALRIKKKWRRKTLPLPSFYWQNPITIEAHVHSAKLCVITWNARVLLPKMCICSLVLVCAVRQSAVSTRPTQEVFAELPSRGLDCHISASGCANSGNIESAVRKHSRFRAPEILYCTR
jgi:hypothetical protein